MQKKMIVASLLSVIMMTSIATAEPFFGKKSKEKAQETELESKQESKKKNDKYEKLFKDEHTTVDGMIKMHKVGAKLYFEFDQNLFGREMLLGSVITETSNNMAGVTGSKSYVPMHIIFTKQGEKVQIREVNSDNYILDDMSEGMVESLGKNNMPTVFKNYDIAAYNDDSTAVVFDVTDLFVSDIKELSPFSYIGMYGGSGSPSLSESFKKDLSFLNGMKGFEDNVTITSTLSYTHSLTNAATRTPIFKDEPFTATMTRTLVLLDDEPYQPRITDSRMSIFPTGKYLYDENQQRTRVLFFANRWKVEPVDMEAWQNGELVDVKDPIVFYIDNGFPESWKPSIMEAVLQWNEVFEKIGFKNVVEAIPFPTDDPDFDPDNIKYSCVRYAPIPIENAMGPSWVDPRSGEIINASVYVFHDVIKMLNEMLFVQTAQVDPRVRNVNVEPEVLFDGLRYVIAHEIGHCLGLMHNMSSSTVIPVDSLRSPSFTQEFGTTTSIMDYARFNYVAQPGDLERGVALTPPRFGVYDYYAMDWLYRPTPEAKDIFESYEITSKWIREASVDPIFRYGKQQMGSVIDPRSQTEDLGDDAIKASEYGIKNLKYILSNMNSWVAEQDKDYSFRNSMYTAIINQYMAYIGHVYSNIGGIYLSETHEGDPAEPYGFVPREKQKRAVEFMLSQLDDMSWLDNKELLKSSAMLGSPKSAVMNAILGAAVSAAAKSTLNLSSQFSEDPYTAEECYKDVSDFVWKPTKANASLTEEQMAIQRAFMVYIAKGSGLTNYPGAGKDSKSFVDDKGGDLDWHFDHSVTCSCSHTGGEFEQFAAKGSHNHTEEVSGFGAPSFRYYTPKNFATEYYTDMLNIQRMLKSKVNSASGETAMHYRYLLHNIEKALEK
ncbi:MAG: zinc-dependent metalloprotease [Rikenellaceae bacterium]